MLGNIVVYLFLAIILALAVAWFVSARSELRAKRGGRSNEGPDERAAQGFVPPP